MILIRTPFRISFVGGGSDFHNFYSMEPGQVISTTINRYIYHAINKKFENNIRLNYSQTELINNPRQIKHPLFNIILNLYRIDSHLEISSLADIPSKGSGLGSSSSFSVGLINGINQFLNKNVTKEFLAKESCNVEINLCKEPIGKQDQYAAAYGGLNHYTFNTDDTVKIKKIRYTDSIDEFKKSLIFFYTGRTRESSSILSEQNKNLNDKIYFNYVREIVDLVKLFESNLKKGNIDLCGKLIDHNWKLKKLLASNISDNFIDSIYDKAMKLGAFGGKLLGAGHGGFLMLVAPKELHNKIKKEINLESYDFDFDTEGSKLIYRD